MIRPNRRGSTSVEVVMNFAVAVPAAFGMLLLMNYLLKSLFQFIGILLEWPLL
jgi:hypothetical protein